MAGAGTGAKQWYDLFISFIICRLLRSYGQFVLVYLFCWSGAKFEHCLEKA